MDAIKVRKGDAKQAGGASSQSVAARRTTNNKNKQVKSSNITSAYV